MKVAPVYLWIAFAYLPVIQIRTFASESSAEKFYQNSGILGKAFICYSVSDVTELNHKLAGTSTIDYIKKENDRFRRE